MFCASLIGPLKSCSNVTWPWQHLEIRTLSQHNLAMPLRTRSEIGWSVFGFRGVAKARLNDILGGARGSRLREETVTTRKS